MADNQSPFVVNQLRPQGGAADGGTYQLDMASVSPTVRVGTDEAGMPIEETRPPAYSKRFVGLDGCIKWVPLRTGAVFSMEPEAERYEQIVMRDIIRDGQLPLWVCPYTNEYKHIAGGPLAKAPPGESDCGGHPDGCVHMKRIMEQRQAASLKKHAALQAKHASMKVEDAAQLMELAGRTFGASVAEHLGAKRANLAKGKGEE